MTQAHNETAAAGLKPFSLRGSSAIVAAALAMATTMPGRTHILGLITVGVLADFHGLSDPGYATLNLFVTLLSALFCFPCGWLIDRLGVKHLGSVLVLLLAGVVMLMSHVQDVWQLGIALTIARGIGQSMLSIVSLAIIGKSFPRRNGPTMGAYAVVMTLLMMFGTVAVQGAIVSSGWRLAWWQLGTWLAACTPVLWFLTPRGLGGDAIATVATINDDRGRHATYWQALATPCFWTFAISISIFGLVTTGFTLFQEKIFAEQNLSREVFYTVQIIGLGVGLLTNLACGGLAKFVRLERLLCVAMVVLASSLAWLPLVNSPQLAYLFGAVYAVGGGMLTVLFFAVWGQAFGTAQLGRIQGSAQFCTVVASALGPLVIATGRAQWGSYHLILWLLGGVCLALGVASLFAPVPAAESGVWNDAPPKLPVVPSLESRG